MTTKTEEQRKEISEQVALLRVATTLAKYRYGQIGFFRAVWTILKIRYARR